MNKRADWRAAASPWSSFYLFPPPPVSCVVSFDEVGRMEFEDLHPDLRPYLRDHVIDHPFVSWPYAYPAYYKRLNQCYLHCVQLQSGIKQPNRWDEYHPDLRVFDRLEMYTRELFSDTLEHKGRFEKERLSFFGECWTSPAVIAQTSSFCEMLIGPPFSRDVSAVMTESEREEWSALPTEMDVYRGSRAGLVQGICWYPDRMVAAKWATIPFNGHLSSGRIKREFVRACFNRRGETELIVCPGSVKNISTETHDTVD